MRTFSFRELSALVSALVIAIVAWQYFPFAFAAAGHPVREMGADGNMHPLDAAFFWLRYAAFGVVFLVLLQALFQGLLAILWRHELQEPRDERDRVVALKSRRYAYEVLAGGVLTVMGYLFFRQVPALLIVQYLLLVLFASEGIRYLLTFTLYRLSV